MRKRRCRNGILGLQLNGSFRSDPGDGGSVAPGEVLPAGRVSCGEDIAGIDASLSDPEIMERLREIASGFGRVRSILPLRARTSQPEPTRLFLVDFESSAEAIIAARALRCIQFAMTAMILSIPPAISAAGRVTSGQS